MELFRRMLRGSEVPCECDHLPAVHWRSDDGDRMWCSAPGCLCKEVIGPGGGPETFSGEGEGFRLIEGRARRKRSA